MALEIPTHFLIWFKIGPSFKVVIQDIPVSGCAQLGPSRSKDEALEESANLHAPEVIAADITTDLDAALEQFATIAENLKTQSAARNWPAGRHLAATLRRFRRRLRPGHIS